MITAAEYESQGFFRLRQYLNSIPEGPVADCIQLAQLLGPCWHELDGGKAERMEGKKLHQRMENIHWSPPLLSFTIERHPGFNYGRSRADLHEWQVDVGRRTAECTTGRYRQVRPMSPRLDVMSIANEIVALIVSGQQDPRLKWYREGHARVLIGKILPDDSAVKETLQARRKRFRTAVAKLLKELGWTNPSDNVYVPPVS